MNDIKMAVLQAIHNYDEAVVDKMRHIATYQGASPLTNLLVAYHYGVIEGKRAERAKRKANA